MDSNPVGLTRYRLVDGIRGILVLGMIIYHTLFDIVYFSGNVENSVLLLSLEVIRDFGAAVFILLSGFCFDFQKHRLRRFLILFFAGLVITAATYFVARNTVVVFGILTFMAVSGALMIPLDKIFKHIPPVAGLFVGMLAFFVLFRVNYAYIGTYGKVFFYLPPGLYKNYFTAFLGFPFNGFSSGDYFPLLPWIFVYFAGYFLKKLSDKSEKLKYLLCFRLPLFDFLGRYSLYIYIAHQPVIYGITAAVFYFISL